MHPDIKLTVTSAKLDDRDRLRAFLAPIDHGDVLGDILSAARDQGSMQPQFRPWYDNERGLTYCVINDAKTVWCFTIAGLSMEEMELVIGGVFELTDPSEAAFREMLVRVLPVNRKATQ